MRLGREWEIDIDELEPDPDFEEQGGFWITLHVKRDQLLDPEEVEPEAAAVPVNEWSKSPLGRCATSPEGSSAIQLGTPDRNLPNEKSIRWFGSRLRQLLDRFALRGRDPFRRE